MNKMKNSGIEWIGEMSKGTCGRTFTNMQLLLNGFQFYFDGSS